MLGVVFVAEFFEWMVRLLCQLAGLRVGNWAGWCGLLHRLVEPWEIDEGVELVWFDELGVTPADVIPVSQLKLVPGPLFFQSESL